MQQKFLITHSCFDRFNRRPALPMNTRLVSSMSFPAAAVAAAAADDDDTSCKKHQLSASLTVIASVRRRWSTPTPVTQRNFSGSVTSSSSPIYWQISIFADHIVLAIWSPIYHYTLPLYVRLYLHRYQYNHTAEPLKKPMSW